MGENARKAAGTQAMSIRSILLPLADPVVAERAVPPALALAGRLGARLTALHPMTAPAAALPLLTDVPIAGVVDQLIAAMERQRAGLAEQTQRAFEAACGKHRIAPVEAFRGAGFAARFLSAAGSEESLVARLGRMHDLILVSGVIGTEPMLAPVPAAALLDTGRPVLMMPQAMPASIGARVLVAWNGSVEAARALSAAVGLVEPAAEIVVAAVGEAERDVASPEDAVAYLDAYGLAATTASPPSAGMAVAEALLLEADRRQADLLVMGAYGHSRLRETILGGVTRDILANLDLPVLMAH